MSIPTSQSGDTMRESSITLHGMDLSGHTHRVVLLLRMLGLNYRFVEASAKARQSDAFLKLNPLGQIPVLQDGDLALAGSNAIMVYLVKRYAPDSIWLPNEPLAAAHVQRWLSIAAGEVKYGPSMARVMSLWNMPGDRNLANATSERLLNFMDAHLATRAFLAAEHPTISDRACYAYVAHAPEGGISLERYAHVRAWLRRVEALPHFVPMPASAAAA
jgi:glutathione S-transferase